MTNHIVKSRERQGTSSLDLTLPAEIRRECSINGGDLFKVTTSTNKNLELVIEYTLIYKNEKL